MIYTGWSGHMHWSGNISWSLGGWSFLPGWDLSGNDQWATLLKASSRPKNIISNIFFLFFASFIISSITVLCSMQPLMPGRNAFCKVGLTKWLALRNASFNTHCCEKLANLEITQSIVNFHIHSKVLIIWLTLWKQNTCKLAKIVENFRSVTKFIFLCPCQGVSDEKFIKWGIL